MTLSLTMACGPYPHTAALRSGEVVPEGIELDYLSLTPPEIFWRMSKSNEFDLSEMSLSTYTMLLSRGDTRFVGIPVFPSRAFRHAFLFVRTDAGIVGPEDLRGARVGVPEYHMTAVMFIRGVLSDDYGLEAQDMRWFQGGQEEPGRIERIDVDLPDGVSLERIRDRSLVEMLAAGALDALATPTAPRGFHDGTLPVRRMFDSPTDVELSWYKRTGVFPIMHLIVLRRDLFEAEPWTARALATAFVSAKQRYYARLRQVAGGLSPLPFLPAHVEETRQAFGDDFFPYGVARNRPTLETALRYSFEQHLSRRRVDVGELFVEPSLDETIYE